MAVLLVVLYHAGVPHITGGYVGVDVFFVISGFLITAHILKDIAEHGRVHFARFYARRMLRILPAAILVLAATLIAATLTIPPLLLPKVFNDGAFTSIYAPNFLFASDNIDYLSDPNPSVFQHYWSLGVEEQFYLVWPAGLTLLYFLARRSARGFAIGLAAIFVASLIGSVLQTEHSQPSAFFMMPFRVWEFAVGGLLALVATATRFQLGSTIAVLARWVGMAAMVMAALLYSSETKFPGVAASVPVLATALVILAGTSHTRGEGSRFANRPTLLTAAPMVFIGTISYSLYLVHWPMLVIPQIAAGDHNPLPLWTNLAIATGCLPVAWALYRWVETPFRQSRLPDPRIIVTSAAATCLLAAVCFGGDRMYAGLVLHTHEMAAPVVAAEDPSESPVVPANMRPSIRDASMSIPAIYELGCHLHASATEPHPCDFGEEASAPHVVLFGDSHAAQWFPPLARLAERGDIRLTTNTMSSCSPFTPGPGQACDTWRMDVIDAINGSPPDLVLISTYVEDQAVQAEPDVWERSVNLALESVDADIPVAIVTDTPQFNMSPAACLSKHLDDVHACGTRPQLALSQPITEAQNHAADDGAAHIIDLTPYFCSDKWCPVVTGDTLMYRDAHHISEQYSAQLHEPLWEQLRPMLGGA